MHRGFYMLSSALALCACAGADSVGPEPPQASLPAGLRFTAEATGTSENGLGVDCSVETEITLTPRTERRDGAVVQSGQGGGDAHRSVTRLNGRVVHFWAETHFAPLEIHLIGADSVEIRHPPSVDTRERFWREFARVAGNTRPSQSPEVLASGAWVCRPMDTLPESGEWYDPEGSAVGTWSLRRTP